MLSKSSNINPNIRFKELIEKCHNHYFKHRAD